MRTVFRYEREQIAAFTKEEPDRYPHLTLHGAIMRYIAAALLVVAAGAWMPFVAHEIADLKRHGESLERRYPVCDGG